MTHAASSAIATARTASIESSKLPSWLDRRLFPFESKFVEFEGRRVHYVDEGTGPVILFVHSAPSWCFYYREMILGLRDRFRCIALDLPGWGLSTASAGFDYSIPEESRTVEDFIEKLGLRDITLAVHDSGGPIALGVAARHPGWFRAFIITSTFGWSLAGYPRVRFMLRLISSWPFRLLNAAFNLLPRLVARFGPRQRKLSTEERAGLTRVFASWSQRDRVVMMLRQLVLQPDYLNAVEKGLRADLADRPALIMFGEVDPVREYGFDKRWEEIFHHHRSSVIAKEQHFAHLGAAKELVANVRSFWDDMIERKLKPGAE